MKLFEFDLINDDNTLASLLYETIRVSNYKILDIILNHKNIANFFKKNFNIYIINSYIFEKIYNNKEALHNIISSPYYKNSQKLQEIYNQIKIRNNLNGF